ncbi:MAG: DEAD/DEAH box helicase, partial [Candidatus Omnitrophota bacterium]|nr:DEAD/DEAH box helicase [Candidatus Omnitrophota bacterium]
MKLADVLAKYHYPDAVRGILSGIENLYPPQAAAIDKGVLDGKNMLLSVPTAAGKTLIAELCLLKSVLLNKGRCLYIAPLKALASEKFNDFKKKYEPLGIPVGLAIGDADSPVRHLNQYKILVATAEKVDSLLRTHAQGLINSLSVVVFDEIHFINDASRGPTLEILVARIKELNPQIQILALSATVSNAAQIAAWLKAELVTSTWRPIPLKEGIYFNDTIMFHEYGTKLIREEEADDLSKLTLDTLRGKGQVLIFVNSRRSAQAVSRQVLGAAAKVLAPAERQQLSGIAKKIIGSRSDATKLCRKLAEVIAGGVAFHHAGLKPHQRELIEDNFRNNLIKVISCTPTLAAGVNLPARRAIIRDVKRYEAGIGPAYIPTSEYKQCAGRAGRPQYDDYGEAVIVAKSLTDTRILYDKYIAAPPEPVTSKLANQAALRIHILASIAGGYIHDIKGMIDFFHHTLLYHQKLAPNLLEMVSEIFDFLHKEKFIEKSGVRFFPTPLGSLTSRIYIDPVTTMTLRDGLIKAVDDNQFAAAGLIHLMDCCPDAPLMHVGKKDAEGLEQF